MLTYLIGGGVGGQKGALAPQTKIGGHPSPPLHVLVPKNTIADAFDNNFDISAHIFCPQTTHEFPKKQERLNNNLLMHCHTSITDTMDTVKTACANEQRKGHFGKFE